jgi:hypothetical protein
MDAETDFGLFEIILILGGIGIFIYFAAQAWKSISGSCVSATVGSKVVAAAAAMPGVIADYAATLPDVIVNQSPPIPGGNPTEPCTPLSDAVTQGANNDAGFFQWIFGLFGSTPPSWLPGGPGCTGPVPSSAPLQNGANPCGQGNGSPSARLICCCCNYTATV